MSDLHRPLLVGSDLWLRYGSTPVLRGIDVRVGASEIVALVGPSGSGKSSLLYCLSRLIRPSSGSVRFQGTELTTHGDDEAARFRREAFGFVFQSAELVPELTLKENVSLPLELLGTPRRETRERVAELLASFGLEDLARRRPHEVSGGQAQRTAVARALVHRPRLIFADEPTGSLDSTNGQLVFQALLGHAREQGHAVVFATHDQGLADAADRRVTLVDGRVMAEQR